ncbi:MAG: TlpA family protein disulfide reductase [Methyloglobulus sp.]|nr:TlpA family protein disulfide reductase [Methyloglobulus sp.]
MKKYPGLSKLCQFALLMCFLQSAQLIAGTDEFSEKVPAPAWTLNDLDGKPNSLASYKGKVVVLNFWGTFCTPCLKEVPAFVATQQQYADNGVVIVGAAMDKNDDAAVKAFAKKYFINYPVVIAPGTMIQDYGVVVAPATFIIDKNGFIVFKHIGALSRKDLAQQLVPLL